MENTLEILIEDLHLHHSIDHYSQFLKNENLYVRCSAVNGIGKLSTLPEIRSVIEPLTSLMIKYADLSALIASDVLGEIGDIANDHVLECTQHYWKSWLRNLSLLKDIREETVSLTYLISTLSKIANPVSCLPLCNLLTETLQAKDDRNIGNQWFRKILQEGFLALGKFHHAQTSHYLIQFINQVDDDLREVLLWALGSSGGEEARSELTKWIQNPVDKLSRKAAETFDQEITIFLSSTFKDMQEDRDAIVNNVIPRLREECTRRGVKISVIDLRWGLTPEDTSRDQSLINACLERIDYCRNHHFLFISLLGYNYGSIKYWEKTGSMHSVTEIEILHALNNNKASQPDLSLFYIREALPDDLEFKGSNLSEEQKSELRKLAQNLHLHIKEQCRKSPIRVKVREGYQHQKLDMLASQVYDDLFGYIDQVFPSMASVSPVYNEILAQYRYQRSMITDHFIPDKKIFELLSESVQPSRDRSLLLFGSEGAGKSSILCHWAEYFSQHNKDALIIYHNFKAAKNADLLENLLRHLVWELNRRQKTTFTEGTKLSIETVFSLSKNLQVILLLDGLESAEAVVQQMDWFPDHSPNGFHLICSATYSETFERLAAKKGWPVEMMNNGLNQKSVETVIKRSFQHYGKSLTTRQLSALLNLNLINNPLFLSTVLNELTFFVPDIKEITHNETIDFEKPILDRILQFAGVKDVEEMYQIVISNLEKKYPGSILPLLTQLAQHDDGMDDVQIQNWMKEKNIPLIDAAGILTLKFYLGENFNIHNAHTAFVHALQNVAAGNKQSNEFVIRDLTSFGKTNNELPRIQFIESEMDKVYRVGQKDLAERFAKYYQHYLLNRLERKLEFTQDLDAFSVIPDRLSEDISALVEKIMENANLAEKQRSACFRKIIRVVDHEHRGGDTNNLANAIKRAPEDAILILAPGNYELSDSFQIKKNLIILGSSQTDTRIITKPSLKNLFNLSGDACLILHGLSIQGNHEKMTMIKLKENSYAILSACEFQGKLKPAASKYEMEFDGIGVQLEKHSSAIIHHCTFRGFSFAGVNTLEKAKPSIINCHFTRNFWGVVCQTDDLCGEYLQNQFTDNICGGIKVELASLPMIINNQFDKNGYCGILFQQNSGGLVKNNQIRRSCELNLIIRDTAAPRVVGNEITDAYWYGVSVKTNNKGVVLYNNKISKNEFGGIRFADNGTGAFFDNVVSENYQTGITVTDLASPAVSHNLVLNNQQNGIGLFGKSKPVIDSNTIMDNGCYGITIVGDSAPMVSSNLSNHNLMSGISITSTGGARVVQNTCMNNQDCGIVINKDCVVTDIDLNICSKNAVSNINQNNDK